ncbi:hypothetical protein GCM10018779_41480 [Streptomyces griseocarneus]|nr:hypothetical protein GCM10018779_41480 [Streptomyces griseocarneus]
MERSTRAPQGIDLSVPNEPGRTVRVRGEGRRGAGRAVGSALLMGLQKGRARGGSEHRPGTVPAAPAAYAGPAGVGRKP